MRFGDWLFNAVQEAQVYCCQLQNNHSAVNSTQFNSILQITVKPPSHFPIPSREHFLPPHPNQNNNKSKSGFSYSLQYPSRPNQLRTARWDRIYERIVNFVLVAFRNVEDKDRRSFWIYIEIRKRLRFLFAFENGKFIGIGTLFVIGAFNFSQYLRLLEGCSFLRVYR